MDKEFFLKHVAPAAGCLVTFAMFASPLSSVAQVLRSKNVGDLNLVPFVLTVANCTSWLAYAYISQNLYIFFSNQVGLILGFYSFLSCYPFAEQQVRDRLKGMTLIFAYLLSLVGCITSLAIEDAKKSKEVWGYTSVGILLLFYGSPLSVMAEVIRTRNSAKILWLMAVMNTVNALLWLCYGLAIGDSFVWGPNGIGAALGFIQLALIAVFPKLESPRKLDLSDEEDAVKAKLVDSLS